MKNGANGINFCFFLYAHAAPNIHASTNEIANPTGPHHSPPTAINLMSPMPMGVSACGSWRVITRSKISPITAAIMYPNVMPITPAPMSCGHGKNVATIAPIIINGNKYASGIMRRRMSATEIFAAKYSPNINSNINTTSIMYKNIFSPLRFESVLRYTYHII